MKGWSWVFLLSMLGTLFLGACADWQVKTPSQEPTTSEEQNRPQGKTSIGGEEGGRGR